MQINNEEWIDCDRAIFAIGHSARDTVEMLFKKGLDIIQKPFSVGVRVEHLRNDIRWKAFFNDYGMSASNQKEREKYLKKLNKKLKYKQADGTLSDYIAIGADASNVDLEEGISLEELNMQLVRNNSSTLTDANGNIINPKTKIENITDENNVSLSALLNNNIIQYTIIPEANSTNINKIIKK